jgi:two-component system, OmpR family, sensor histidine kinase KdpD
MQAGCTVAPRPRVRRPTNGNPADQPRVAEKGPSVSDSLTRPSAEALLREFGDAPRLTVYLSSASGAGKTRRLIEDAVRALHAGKRIAIGWIETKGRPDLEELAKPLPRIPPRVVRIGSSEFFDFDYAAALDRHPQVVVLDELAHANLEGGAHAKRWQDALALREHGLSVIGALNIQHIETVAAVAESIIGFPVREIVPISFLRAADQVIALDVSPEQIEARLRAGSIVRPEDIERALGGAFRPQNLRLLRELMLRTIDDLSVPILSPAKSSTALAVLTGDGDAASFVRRTSALARDLDLALEVTVAPGAAAPDLARITADYGADIVRLSDFEWGKPKLDNVRATLVAVPNGPFALKIATSPTVRDIFIVDPTPAEALPTERSAGLGPMGQAAGDLLRIGYGRLTVYLGSAAGSGKTFAMLDRAHQLKAAGVDVVAAFIETHGRAETAELLEGLELLARKEIAQGGLRYGEPDVEAVLFRRPEIALIDELAHTNAPGSAHHKRFDDVLSILRAGISVMTTLNVQHLEGLGDAVYRLTGQRVRETLPDSILELADDVILIDTTPETLRERLRSGKIYPAERIERALANFFRVENLAALRELALREVMRARSGSRQPAPFARLALGVKARERDVALIERCARLALRLEIDLDVLHVTRSRGAADTRIVSALEEASRRVRARWRSIEHADPARGLLEAAAVDRSTIAVEGARNLPRWPRLGTPFARRLLDAGAKQLLILAPQAG